MTSIMSVQNNITVHPNAILPPFPHKKPSEEPHTHAFQKGNSRKSLDATTLNKIQNLEV